MSAEISLKFHGRGWESFFTSQPSSLKVERILALSLVAHLPSTFHEATSANYHSQDSTFLQKYQTKHSLEEHKEHTK